MLCIVGLPQARAVCEAVNTIHLVGLPVKTGPVQGETTALVVSPKTRPESVSGERGLAPIHGGDVGVRLRGVAHGEIGVIGVQAMSPLVVHDCRDLSEIATLMAAFLAAASPTLVAQGIREAGGATGLVADETALPAPDLGAIPGCVALEQGDRAVDSHPERLGLPSYPRIVRQPASGHLGNLVHLIGH